MEHGCRFTLCGAVACLFRKAKLSLTPRNALLGGVLVLQWNFQGRAGEGRTGMGVRLSMVMLGKYGI